MRSAMRLLSSLALVLVLTAGCSSTVTPKVVTDPGPSWDVGERNSGFLAFDSRGWGVITPHARDRYNALVVLYGGVYKPPVRVDDGIEATGTNTYLIDPEHLVKFATMNRWFKSGKDAP